jgi:hypothetical protein
LSRRFPSSVAFATALEEALLMDDAPGRAPRLHWQDEPDPAAPGDDTPPPLSPSSPGPRLARTDDVESTPALMDSLESAFRRNVFGAVLGVLLPSALILTPLFVVGAGSAGAAIVIVLLLIGLVVYIAGRAMARAMRLWDALRAPGFRRVAGRVHVSEHSYIPNRSHTPRHVYLPNSVILPTTADAVNALRRAGTSVSKPVGLRIEPGRLRGVWAVDGVAIYSETARMLIEVTRADGTEIFAEPAYRQAKRRAQKRTAT